MPSWPPSRSLRTTGTVRGTTPSPTTIPRSKKLIELRLLSACFRPSTASCCLPGSRAYRVGVGSRDALTRGGALLLGGGGSHVPEHGRVAVGGRSLPSASTPLERSRRHRAAAVRP